MINWLVFCSFITSIMMTLIGLMVDLSYQMQLAPQLSQIRDQQQSELSDYLKSKDFYENHDVFNPAIASGENFALLWQRSVSDGGAQALVPEDLKREFLSLGEKWLDQKHKIQLPKNLMLLFRKVPDYGYWKPIEGVTNDMATDLIVAAQLFLAYTYYFQPTASQEALVRVRHLSQILLGMQELNFKRAGLSILDKEREFMEFLKARLLKSQWLWTPVSKDELRQYRKFLGKTSQYLSYLTAPHVLDQVFLSSTPPIGFCSLLKNKVKILTWSKKFLSGQFPFEPSFAESMEAMGKIEAKANDICQSQIQTVDSEHGDLISKIPYYRRLYGIKMLLNADQAGQLL